MYQIPRRLLAIVLPLLPIHQFSVQREYKKISQKIIEELHQTGIFFRSSDFQIGTTLLFSFLNPHVCYLITLKRKRKQHVVSDFLKICLSIYVLGKLHLFTLNLFLRTWTSSSIIFLVLNSTIPSENKMGNLIGYICPGMKQMCNVEISQTPTQ